MLLLFTGILSLFFPRCANIVPPAGGPRDTIPPAVLSSDPPNYSTNFRGSLIQVEFDEFIQLRNINQQFIITPPQKERPEFRLRGRRLYISLESDPIPNTTYTLNFGEAIADLNEGNILRNFEFVFSTGDVIDSLNYSGIVLNAFDNTPVENVTVMLYEELHDSVPYRRIPLYANRTGADGKFSLNNLRTDTFKVFALADVNNNYLYDRKGEEKIAFPDDFIFPSPAAQDEIIMPPDSITGSGGTEEDSVPDDPESAAITDTPDENMSAVQDTTVLQPAIDSEGLTPLFGFPQDDTLYLFGEETGRQYLSRTERAQRGKLLFVFNLPLRGDWSIEPVSFEPPGEWLITEKSPRNDSIIYWITDPETRNTNNMRYLISYMATGPSDSLRQVTDTINMNYTAPSVSRRQAQAQESPPGMNIGFSIPADGTQELNKSLRLSFPAPLSLIDNEKINLSSSPGDTWTERDFNLIRDSLQIRNYMVETSWIPGANYRLEADPGAFTDIFGLESDSMDFTFTTREEDHYGRIILSLSGISGDIIVQLLNDREIIQREFFMAEDGDLVMDYLQPGQFRIRVIFDTNNNGKWDTGDYMKGIQPERVIFFRDIITTRSNWDIEEEWELEFP